MSAYPGIALTEFCLFGRAICRELVETEEEFVRDLGFVMENYYNALGSGNKLAKYRELFGSLKAIYEFHQGSVVNVNMMTKCWIKGKEI